jgi:hypothetical protein
MVDAGPEGGGGFGDGFLQMGCNIKADCDDSNNCTKDVCAPDHTCKNDPIPCGMLDDECNDGTCNPANGMCEARPSTAKEGKTCGAMTMMPGICKMGMCMPVPLCEQSFTSLDCSSWSASNSDTTTGHMNVLDTYACATGETGPELAFPFLVTTDRTVTISLANTTADLDLIVLDGNACTSMATCVASSLTTGADQVTFHAMANHDYVVVVDGKNGAVGDFDINVSCASCQPIQALACNQSYPGDTTAATATTVMSSYDCAMMEPGPENSYTLAQSLDTSYRITARSLTQDLDLIVVLDDSGQCDPTWCKAESLNTGTADEVVSFIGYSSSTYAVIVDSKSTGGPYVLEVQCPPSCYTSGNTISCTQSDSMSSDDPVHSKDLVDTWSCPGGTGYTGNEVVFHFSPAVNGMYTAELTGIVGGQDLDLFILEGGFSSCDPTGTCVGQSIHAGNANESVDFMGDSTKDYYVAVDSKGGASTFTLKIKGAACPGPSCYQAANNVSCTYLEEKRRNDDAARSKNQIDDWQCDPGTSGPEVVYKFAPPMPGQYKVDLDELTADLDLIVVDSTSAFSCDASVMCDAFSNQGNTTPESVTFTTVAGKTYYIGVDGYNGAVGDFHIKLSSLTPGNCPAAPQCTNGFKSLSCSSPTLFNHNDNQGATSDVTNWTGCAGFTNMTGPEFAHLFTPTGAGPFTIQMIGLQDNLDMLVLETASSSMCDPTATCKASSKLLGTSNESVTFTADPSKKYWIIVDGKADAISPYFLNVTAGCPP